METNQTTRIFISYKHDDDDEKFLNEFMAYIKRPIEAIGGRFWFDSEIEWGEFWDASIKEHLEAADIGIVLASQLYLNSIYITDEEVTRLVEKRTRGELIILPIIVGPCDWEEHQWLASTQFLPPRGKTIRRDYKDRADREELFKDILNRLRNLVQNLQKKNVRDDIEMNDLSTSTGTVHIMTSVKGGVGKTLLSLATFCSYLENYTAQGAGKLLCVDINMINNDLYRILAGRSEGEMLRSTDWRVSRIQHDYECYVAKRRIPYALVNGAAGFWSELIEILEHDKFKGFDVIVDTNLHVANLVEGDGHPERMILELCSGKHSKSIYLWILWNFASLIDHEYVEMGIATLSSFLHPNMTNKINVVHVLNPSALTRPQNSINDEIKALMRIQSIRDTYDRLIQQHEEDGNLDQKEKVRELRDDYLRTMLGTINLAELEYGNTPRPFPGLYELIHHEKATSEITYSDFIERVGSKIVQSDEEFLATIFDRIYMEEFERMGRPRNLLPISVHDPRLHGYTEFMSAPDIIGICEQISHISNDVRIFLQALTKANRL